jgi:site-specific recombinase XerD
MPTELILYSDPRTLLIPPGASKDARYRLGKFANWLTKTGRQWYEPDLAGYRDELLDTYAPSTVSAHLSTIRARYNEILRDNGTRDALYARFPHMGNDTPANRKAYVDEILTRLSNAIDPKASQVKQKTHQDRPDSAHLRLTTEQANRLLSLPGVDTLAGLRDTAILAVLLCTGIREAELSSLDVEDLRQELGGALALHVREGKGCKERLVPYGELEWVLAVVDKWLERAGIGEGPVFRGFYKGNRKLRPGRLSVRAIEYIVGNYPVMVNGDMVTVKPHDLRRTYARRLYDAGFDLVAIQQNLGHADVKTTLGYIGTLGAEQRKPPAVFTFDLRQLNGVRAREQGENA